MAKKHFIEDGNNRVILATDGDFNIGISSYGDLKEFIASKRNDGIYLTCIGLGENYDYSSSTMEALAKSGNGYWGYIDGVGVMQSEFIGKSISFEKSSWLAFASLYLMLTLAIFCI